MGLDHVAAVVLFLVATLSVGTVSLGSDGVVLAHGSLRSYSQPAGFPAVSRASSPCINCLGPAIPVGNYPQAPSIDPQNGNVFVPDEESGTVSVISGATGEVIANTSVGSDPVWPIFDPHSGDVDVTYDNSGERNISVLSGDSGALLTTIPFAGNPSAPTYVSDSGTLYVVVAGRSPGECCWYNLTEISDTTDQVISTEPLVSAPQHASIPSPSLFDPANNMLYIPEPFDNKVGVFSVSSNSLLDTLDVGGGPETPMMIPSSTTMYVSNIDSDNISVIDVSSSRVVGSIPVGVQPLVPEFDPVSGDLYVSNWASGNLSVINPTTESVVATLPMGYAPNEPLFDPGTEDLYVTQAFEGNLSILTGSTGRHVATLTLGSYPCAPVYDSWNGDIYVSNTISDNVSVIRGNESVRVQAFAQAAPSNATVGEGVQFGSNASGGTPPYSWTWRFADGGSATMQNATHAYTSPGTFNATLWVNDSTGRSVSKVLDIHVLPASPTGSLTTTQELELAIGLVAAVVLLGVFVLISRRRRRSQLDEQQPPVDGARAEVRGQTTGRR